MSSFNLQCFASKQVITAGDACRVMAMCKRQTKTPGGPASQLSWEPLTGFIPCVYASDGELTLQDSEEAQLLAIEFLQRFDRCGHFSPERNLKAQFESSVSPLLGARWVAHLSASQLSSCFNTVWACAQRGEVDYQCDGSRREALVFAVLHEQAYQALLQHWESNGETQRDILAIARAEAIHVCPLGSLADHVFMEVVYDYVANFGGRLGLTSLEYAENRRLKQARETCQVTQSPSSGDGAFSEEVQRILSDRKVLVAMHQLGVFPQPVLLLPSVEADCNESGQAYADFVQSVCQQVSLAVVERQFGPVTMYEALAPLSVDMDELARKVKSWGGRIVRGACKVVPEGEGKEVLFGCTLPLEDLKNFLKSVDPTHSMAQTVAAVVA